MNATLIGGPMDGKRVDIPDGLSEIVIPFQINNTTSFISEEADISELMRPAFGRIHYRIKPGQMRKYRNSPFEFVYTNSST